MSDQVDGNSQSDGQPAQEVHATNIMDSLAPGAFGVTETTSDVNAGIGNVEHKMMTPSDGSMGAFVEHHLLGSISTAPPQQDFAGVRDAGSM